MDPHALLLSRIQFGFTISAHIIFPAFTIGSSAFVATLLVLWRRTGRDHYLRIARFWTMISAFWILAANSWMQTPAGHIVQNGLAIPTDWFHVIFNPSFPYRFTHMMTAAYLTTSVVVLAAGARYLLEGKFQEEARTMPRSRFRAWVA